MVVVPDGDGTGLFEVWTGDCDEEDGQPYTVDLGGAHDRCSCPDMEYNLSDGERCKHARRVRLEFGLPPFEDVPQLRSSHAAPMDVELARRRRGIDDVKEPVEQPEPEPVEPITASVEETKPARRVIADGGTVVESNPERAPETRDESPEITDVAALDVHRIATEAVANADGPLADFDVFCVTVEAIHETLFRLTREEVRA